MVRKSLSLAAAGAALGLGLMLSQGGTADAQVLRGHNTNAPVDFAADRIEVQDRQDRVVHDGAATHRRLS